MSDLNKKASVGLARFFICLGALVFLPAWTLAYWQGWVFLFVFCVLSLAITVYLMKHDPKLLERRLKAGPRAEKEKAQKFIQIITSVGFLVGIVFSVIDHRFSWSIVPTYAAIMGNILVAVGFLIIFLVFKENTFTSGIIEVAPEQKVISTGPYGLVRHPLYAGAFVMLLSMPLALGSLWGLLAIIPIMFGIVWRLLDEEKFLAKNLSGYAEYQEKVKYRLLPFVW